MAAKSATSRGVIGTFPESGLAAELKENTTGPFVRAGASWMWAGACLITTRSFASSGKDSLEMLRLWTTDDPVILLQLLPNLSFHRCEASRDRDLRFGVKVPASS